MVDRWKRLAPLSGVLMVALIVAGFLVGGDTPDTDASAQKVISYFSSHHDRMNAAIVLMLYGTLFLVIYYVSVARFLRRQGADVLAEVAVAGSIIFAAGICLGAGTIAVFTDHFSNLSQDPQLVRTLNVINEDLWWPLTMVGFTIATLAIGISMLRTKAVPKALAIVTLVVAAGGLSGIGTWFAFMLNGLLVLVTAGVVYQRMGQQRSIAMPDVPDQREVTDVPSRETTAN